MRHGAKNLACRADFFSACKWGLCFLAHCRHFRLHLIPHVELFSEDFHAYSVGENNEKIEIAVDKDSFYKGYDEGITLSFFTPVCDS